MTRLRYILPQPVFVVWPSRFLQTDQKIEQMFAKSLDKRKHAFYYSLAAVPEALVYPKGKAVTMPVIGREKTNR